MISTDIYVALEQELYLPSRSEYIQLLVSRLGLPSEYDYWLREYSLNTPLKSITTRRNGSREKTKTVLKSVSKMQQFGSMQNSKFQTFAK